MYGSSQLTVEVKALVIHTVGKVIIAGGISLLYISDCGVLLCRGKSIYAGVYFSRYSPVHLFRAGNFVVTPLIGCFIILLFVMG